MVNRLLGYSALSAPSLTSVLGAGCIVALHAKYGSPMDMLVNALLWPGALAAVAYVMQRGGFVKAGADGAGVWVGMFWSISYVVQLSAAG